VELRVEVEHQRGIIATLANSITSEEANIEKMTMTDRDAQFSLIHLTLAVRNRVHLARVMKRVRRFKYVTRVTRVRN
jgi:guanosine-3',5'-bis(diphosphate) 3'-pyrophosphohydrolase